MRTWAYYRGTAPNNIITITINEQLLNITYTNITSLGVEPLEMFRLRIQTLVFLGLREGLESWSLPINFSFLIFVIQCLTTLKLFMKRTTLSKNKYLDVKKKIARSMILDYLYTWV